MLNYVELGKAQQSICCLVGLHAQGLCHSLKIESGQNLQQPQQLRFDIVKLQPSQIFGRLAVLPLYEFGGTRQKTGEATSTYFLNYSIEIVWMPIRQLNDVGYLSFRCQNALIAQ